MRVVHTIYTDDPAEAHATLELMKKTIEKDGYVMLGEYYFLIGIENIKNEWFYYGWTNLDDVIVKYNMKEKGWFLTMPPAELLEVRFGRKTA